MSNDERVTKPRLERRGPIRSWSTLFGTAAPDAEPSGSPGSRTAGADDVVARSVELGYRVIDDWMQQGQRAAHRMSSGGYDPDTMGQEVQDVAARIAQHASDLFGLWLELFEMAAARAAPRSGPESAAEGNGGPPAAPTTASQSRVRVEVAADVPTEVTLDLQIDAGAHDLIVHALRAADREAPRIDDVTVGRDGDAADVVVRLRVPTGHPSGTYSGLIVDGRSNLPAGSLSVRVGSPATEP